MSDTFGQADALLIAGILPAAPGPYFGQYILKPRGTSPEEAASKMGLGREFIIAFLRDKIVVDRSLADRLAQFSNTTPEFWLNLEAAWSQAKLAVSPADRQKYIQIEPYFS